LVGRRKALLEKLQRSLNTPSTIYAVDVSDEHQLHHAIERHIKKMGVPDIVIANAGVSTGTLNSEKEDLVTFKRVVDINLYGVMHTFLPFMHTFKKRKLGQLVGIASVAGIRGLPGSGAYSTSKAALMNYLESLRIEMLPFNIQVTTIAPGYIKTPMTHSNPYAMPFILEVDEAASLFIKAINRKEKFIIIPWQMNIVGRLMRLLPTSVWDFLAKRGPKKLRAMI
jgi:short-subunit dehydrogenase